ncbi:MAG: hypothetical protein R3D52_04790 [Xanthobacteraceae bacterium]
MRFATLLRAIPAAAVLAAALLVQLPHGFAHEGEDHAHAPQPAAGAATAAPRAEAVSDQFELVAVARGGALAIYLDRFRTNEPVVDAAISVETPAGAAPASPIDGAYRLDAPWSAAPGRHDLIFTVTPKDGAADVLIATLAVPGNAPAGPDQAVASLFSSAAFAGELKNRVANSDPLLIATAIGGFVFGLLVMAIIGRRKIMPVLAVLAALSALPNRPGLAHEGEDHSQAPPLNSTIGDRDLSQRLADGALFVPKPTQRILAIRTDIATAATHRRMIELPGRIIPDPNASGYVQALPAGACRRRRADSRAWGRASTKGMSSPLWRGRCRRSMLRTSASAKENLTSRSASSSAGSPALTPWSKGGYHAGPARRGAPRTAGAEGSPQRA